MNPELAKRLTCIPEQMDMDVVSDTDGQQNVPNNNHGNNNWAAWRSTTEYTVPHAEAVKNLV